MIVDMTTIRTAINASVFGDCAKPEKVEMMTANELRRQLANFMLSQHGFASLTGANPRTVIRWTNGEQDIPPWVTLVLDLIRIGCPPKLGETPTLYMARLNFYLASGGRHV